VVRRCGDATRAGHAQEAGQLVIFVGAGGSIGHPSDLPSFGRLTEIIRDESELNDVIDDALFWVGMRAGVVGLVAMAFSNEVGTITTLSVNGNRNLTIWRQSNFDQLGSLVVGRDGGDAAEVSVFDAVAVSFECDEWNANRLGWTPGAGVVTVCLLGRWGGVGRVRCAAGFGHASRLLGRLR
jgi:hypothetical protein